MPFAASGKAKIFFDVDGNGPPLVFLHGGGSNGAGWWRQIGHFRQTHRCIVIDNRCFGRSEPVDPSIYWPKLFVDDVLAVLNRLDIAAAPFVCQSLGGWTGLRLALSHPERITHLVVGSSPMGIESREAMADAQRFARSVGKEGQEIETAALGASFRQQHPELVWLYRQIGAFNRLNDRGDGGPLPVHERTRRLFAPDYVVSKDRLAEVVCPTLLIAGAEDRIVTPRTAKGFADLIPGAEYAQIEGAGHSPFFETPERYNEIVSSFLARHAATDRGRFGADVAPERGTEQA